MLSIEQVEGLRILTELSNGKSNIVINSGSKIIKPSFHLNQIKPPSIISSCFLKSCFLCKKKLSLDKEVYMYRGDQGFCSVECRSRQICIDEIKEIETSTKKAIASYRRRGNCSRCETGGLLDEYRQRSHPFSSKKNRIAFS